MREAAAVAAALAGLLLVACGGGAERGGSGDILEAGRLSVFSFRTGDCFNGFAAVESVDAIPCDQPHEAEVYLLVDHPGGERRPVSG